MNPKAIAFDLDDTLFLERDYVSSGFGAAGEWFRTAFGLTDFARRAEEHFLAGRRGRIFDDVLASYGMVPDPVLVGRLVRVYREHRPSITLLEDARACLDRLRGNYRLALITDGPSVSQWSKIRALDIAPLFETIVVTGELGAGYSKPHPLAFRLVEERLGLHGDQQMYIGDNPRKDFQAPWKLGWRTVCVSRPMGLYTDDPNCDAIGHRIPDLLSLHALLSSQ